MLWLSGYDLSREERYALTQDAKRDASLCVRILGTDYADDHTVYILWVLDVLAGAEWRVPRRFRELCGALVLGEDS